MDVLVKVKELCEAILESAQFKELVRTETILLHDADAQELIRHFNDVQNKLDKCYRLGKKGDPMDFEELRKIEKQLNTDPSAGQYFKAQQQFTDLLSQVNNMINEAIKMRNQGTGAKCSCGKHTF